MRLQDVIPRSGLPRTGFPENVSEAWFGQDSAEAFRRSGGHPRFGEADIVYRFNELGYRSKAFSAPTDLRVLAIGCSWVFGVGLPEPAIFHQRFGERLAQTTGRSVTTFNLGVPGASNDAIVRLLHMAMPVLRPDAVLVFFTHSGRREYLAPHNRYLRYTPRATPTDAVGKEISSHFEALSSSYDDRLNLFRNYKSAEALLARRPWCYSLVKPEDISLLGDHLDPERRARRPDWLDVARDHAHPGAETHADIFEAFWEAFERCGAHAAVRDEAGRA